MTMRERCNACNLEHHFVVHGRREATNICFIGLMGSCEMESALAVMVNLALERRCLFADSPVQMSDFKDDGYDRGGFHELRAYGWIEQRGDLFYPTADLVRRLHKRMPNA